MNIIGKILVILNLVFALVVGGFLVIDFATRTNWKQAYDKLKQEMQVAKVNTDVSSKTMAELNNTVKRLTADLETEKQKLVQQETEAKVLLESTKVDLQVAKDQTQEANLNYQKSLAEKERLKTEVKDRDAVIAQRDKTILELQEAKKKYQLAAIAAENVAKAMGERNEEVLKQLQEALRKLAVAEASGGAAKPSLKDPNAPNPPPAYVKGTVEKVFPDDPNYVQITLGSDHGVQKNHTLEVYRLSPRPEYVGMIRIVDAHPHKSIGRLIRTGPVPKKMLPGDTVASSTTSQ